MYRPVCLWHGVGGVRPRGVRLAPGVSRGTLSKLGVRIQDDSGPLASGADGRGLLGSGPDRGRVWVGSCPVQRRLQPESSMGSSCHVGLWPVANALSPLARRERPVARSAGVVYSSSRPRVSGIHIQRKAAARKDTAIREKGEAEPPGLGQAPDGERCRGADDASGVVRQSLGGGPDATSDRARPSARRSR